jgi:hypothetical protein
MPLASDAAPLDQIIELAHEIIDECPACAGTASEIAMWANEIRERRPGREDRQLWSMPRAQACPQISGRS